PILAEQVVRSTLEAEYKRPLSEVFEEFSFKPLATASIGQVHEARHRGRRVVVKFARPGICAQLRQDSRIALILLDFTIRACYRLRIPVLAAVASAYRQAVREISTGMMEETDLEHERKNAETLLKATADIQDLVIPRLVPELCTQNVLAMEYISGTKISDIEALRRQGHDFTDVMNRLVAIYVRMIIVKGVYHADPHPGNIQVLSDGRILLYDFGIVRTLSSTTRKHLFHLAMAAIRKDLETVIDKLYCLGILKASADRTIALDVAQRFVSLHFQGLNSRDRIGEIAETIYSAFQGFPLELPQELVYVFRCLSLIEGLGTRYRPGWNFLADGYPGIRSALTEYLLQTEGRWWQLFTGFLQMLFNRLADRLRR
ncbi:MAG: AarF/ABC1/UbiB kinase family protein, partial [Candidatus Bathyarchaeia archaeon]